MKRTMGAKVNYWTKDLSEAAFLYASGKKLIRVEDDSFRYWFIFGNQKECQKLVDKYWQKEAKINAKEYADATRSLKDLIFNKRKR